MNTHYVLLEYVSRVYANKHLAHGHTNNAIVKFMLIRFRRKNALLHNTARAYVICS